MADEKQSEESPPPSPPEEVRERQEEAPKPPPTAESTTPIVGKIVAPKKLTEAEQMALYEDDLKENDWGHQPC